MQLIDKDDLKAIERDILALRMRGLKCRVRWMAIHRMLLLAQTDPVAGELVKTIHKVLAHEGPERKRFGYIMDVDQLLRGLLEGIFVDAPWSVSGHLTGQPDWMEEITTFEGTRHPDHPGKDD